MPCDTAVWQGPSWISGNGAIVRTGMTGERFDRRLSEEGGGSLKAGRQLQRAADPPEVSHGSRPENRIENVESAAESRQQFSRVLLIGVAFE